MPHLLHPPLIAQHVEMEKESFCLQNLLECLGFPRHASSILGLVIRYLRHLHWDILMASGRCGRQGSIHLNYMISRRDFSSPEDSSPSSPSSSRGLYSHQRVGPQWQQRKKQMWTY